MIEVGNQFPEFALPSHKGKTVTSKDLKGKVFVLFAYPRAMTPGCTKEVCSIRDHFAELKERGVIPLGISNDSVEKNRKFAEKHNIQYELLSDVDNTLLTALDAYGEKKLYGKISTGVKRYTWLVDAEYKLVKLFKKVKTAEHGDEVLAAVDKLGL